MESGLKQLQKAADLMGLDSSVLARLQIPSREFQFSIPVKMDDGSINVYQGYRVQYDNSRGPNKGGIRFHPDVNIHEVRALSFWMAFKCSVVGIPLGGGKGGVIVNPKELSEGELERLSRGYMRKVASFIGPTRDVPAPDVYTNPQIMAWMMDEYETITREHAPGVITGKPLPVGGSEGRGYSTAQGGVYCTLQLAEKLGLNKDGGEGATVAIQGFGNAGAYMAKILTGHGYKIVAVSDSRGAIYNADGLDVEAVEKHKMETKSVAGFAGTEEITNESILELEVDILVPAALENVITKENAGNVKAKAVVELANGPTTPEADEILHGNGVVVVPDILANAGGVTVSYFEQVQNAYNYYWSEEEVLGKLEPIMVDAFNAVWAAKEEHSSDMRTGAYVVAAGRIQDAMLARGL